MATAAELLSASESLYIDVASRTIIIPQKLKLLGVTSDEKVQKLVFTMSRHYNGIDLSTHTIRINYENAQGEGDVYGATDIQVTSDTISFTWVVSRHATAYQGNVKFTVCAIKTNGESEIVSEFNTIPTTLPVVEGLETDPTEDLEEYPDVIDAVARETLAKAKENGDFTPVKGEDYYTPEEAEAFGQMVVDNANGQFANAIKGVKSGEVVRVDDVSPIEHIINCRVHGKNLFNIDAVVDGSYGVYSVDSSGSVTFNYASDYGNYFPFAYWLDVRPNTDYTVTIGSHTSILNIYGYTDKVFGTQAFAKVLGDSDFITFNSGNHTRILIGFYSVTSYRDLSVTQEVVSNIQIEEGIVATAYEPYLDPTTVTVTRCGKNMFDKNAVTSDYMLEVDGTLTKVTDNEVCVSDYIRVEAGETYYITKTSSHRAKFYDVNKRPLTTDAFDMTGLSGGCSFTVPDGVAYMRFTLYLSVMDTIQLELGSEVTTYESYKGSTVVPDSDGTCSFVSVSPTMTVFTDTPGAIVEVEYSRDTTKMFESYVLTDRAIGAITAEIEDDMVEVLEALNSYAASLTGGVD